MLKVSSSGIVRWLRRGEIYWVELDPVKGSKIQKTRPVVILSNDKQNQYNEEVIVALISSQLDKVCYFEPEIFLKKKSKILTDQILTIDKGRLGDKITSLNL